MKFRYFARLTKANGHQGFYDIFAYKDGFYHVYIDWVYPMELKRIVVRQEL